jgi:hypothetical protein
MGKRTVVTSAAATAAALVVAGGVSIAHADVTPRAAFSQTLEAEHDGIPSNGVHTVDCGFCSGGARVAGLGGHDNGDLTFYFWIPAEADYTVTVYYVSGATRALSVNRKRLTGLNSGGWDKVGKRSVKVHLKEEFHRPAILDLGYDTHSRGADVDKVVVTS